MRGAQQQEQRLVEHSVGQHECVDQLLALMIDAADKRIALRR